MKGCCEPLQGPTIKSSIRHSLTRWGCIPRHAIGINILSGSFMPTYPPLRSAMIRKFMVRFELLGGPQRDITPSLQQRRCGEPKRGFQHRSPYRCKKLSRLALISTLITCTNTLSQELATTAHISNLGLVEIKSPCELWKPVTVMGCDACISLGRFQHLFLTSLHWLPKV